MPVQVIAISESDRNAILRNTPFYDPTATYATCYDGDFSGSENAQIIFNYLVSKGFTHEQAAGFVGNFHKETVGTFDPTIENFSGSGAKGIAQWLGTRLDRLEDFAEAQGKDPWVLATQLEFIWFELTGEPLIPGVGGGYETRAYTFIVSAETVEYAAFAVANFYERYQAAIDYDSDEPNQPGYEEAFGERIELAEQAYILYAPNASEPGEIDQLNCGGLGVSLDGFVFPIKSTQSSIDWCSGSFGNCHGSAWSGTYYAYDIFEAGGGGAEVVAVRNGTIRRFSPDYGCGDPQLSFWLEGDDGNSYFYQHLDATVLMVSSNEQVSAGQTLGVIGPNAYVGATCSNTPPHVHFAASSISSVSGETMSMYRGCTQSNCPNMDKLLDIASVLKAAYDALPQ